MGKSIRSELITNITAYIVERAGHIEKQYARGLITDVEKIDLKNELIKYMSDTLSKL